MITNGIIYKKVYTDGQCMLSPSYRTWLDELTSPIHKHALDKTILKNWLWQISTLMSLCWLGYHSSGPTTPLVSRFDVQSCSENIDLTKLLFASSRNVTYNDQGQAVYCAEEHRALIHFNLVDFWAQSLLAPRTNCHVSLSSGTFHVHQLIYDNQKHPKLANL